MRRIRLSILTGSAVALVMAAATSAGANPIYPNMSGSERMPAPASRDTGSPASRARPANMFGPSDATTRSRAVARPPVLTHQPNARIISTPNAPAAPGKPAPAHANILPAAAAAAPATSTSAPPPAEPVAPVAAAPTAVQPAVSEPVKAPAAAGFAASDSEVADKVRELIASRKQIERIAPRKNERDAIEALYLKNRSMPLWFTTGSPSERARDAIAHLRTVDADGLDPADYPVNLSASSVEGLAEAELKFTATVLTYARHAMNGRVHFSRVSPSIHYKDNFDAADAMQQIAASNDIKRTLDGFNPQHAGYKALKAKYAEMRNRPAETGPARIAGGAVLKYGKDRHGRETFMLDPRVPQLRQRLGLPAAADTRYDRALANAVATFQKANGLTANGQLNAATLDALNGPNRDQQMAAVVATLERWRWMPRELGRTHVALNIPDFHLKVMHNGAQAWKTRVVVGKPSQATPLLTETMKFITVNPTWNVPQSIIYNELLPIYESTDPNIFARMGLQVERKPNGEVRVFQPPGERNALGRIRFNFPNKFLVYQHDTPEKHYFAHDKRAYSHGCMRVQDPLKYAEVLLSYAVPRANYSQASIHRMFGGEERQIDFAHHIPVHISYQTAFVDDSGKLVFRDDVYGLDKAVMAQLRGSERNVADVSIERPADPNFKPTPQHVQRMHSAARGGSPFSLFEQLFR
jgi:murein L,D-transpeptidase YcbB/YkuD